MIAHNFRKARARALIAWRWWELAANHLWRSEAIPGAENGVFRIRLEQYRGEPLQLPDGTTIVRGDLVGELHIDNHALARTVESNKWNAFVRMRADLQALARASDQGQLPVALAALHGLSLLSRGSERLGFTVQPRKVTLWLRLQRVYMTGLLEIYTREGLSRFDRGGDRNTYPADVWMSRKELLRRYGP